MSDNGMPDSSQTTKGHSADNTLRRMESQSKKFIAANIARHIRFLAMTAPSMVSPGDKVMAFLGSTDNPFDRSNLTGHITCSAFVVNQSFTRAILIKHKGLDRWLQPGGHMDPGEYPAEAAVREAREETGISEIQIWPPGLIDIDIHTIPENAGKEEPEHTHYDLRYLCITGEEVLSPDLKETNGAEWVAMEDILGDPAMPESIKRMARAARMMN